MNKIIETFSNDHPDYKRLSNLYEEEFSPITVAQADKHGNYPISTPIDETHLGYFITHLGKPSGFIVVDIDERPFDVCEIFVPPEFRNHHFATDLIKAVFERHKGKWQVKQLLEAEKAHKFWLKFLKGYVDFQEDIYEDPKWGKVHRQTFEVK